MGSSYAGARSPRRSRKRHLGGYATNVLRTSLRAPASGFAPRSREGEDGGGGRRADEEAGEHVERVVDAEVDPGEGNEGTGEQEGRRERRVDGR